MSGRRSRSRTRNAPSVGFSGWKIVSSSDSAATFTGGGISVARERPCGASGCVTTATTSNPSPTSARSEGTANSGVPKNATRIYSSPAGSGVTSLRYPVCPLRAFFHFESSRLRFGARTAALLIERLDDDVQGTRDVAEDVGDRQAPLFGGLVLFPPLDDDRIDEHEGRRILFADVDDGYAAGDADLIGGEPDALRGAHRFEQIVDKLAHRVIHLRDRRGLLPQDR